MFLSLFAIQRDPGWLPDPEAFQPERWSEPPSERPRFDWCPFGAGPRFCVGDHFATPRLTLSVAAMARLRRLRPVVES